MQTLAVVCDDVIECHNNQDERHCDGPKDDTVPYILTSITGMFYVALKLYWWFYQRHQDLDDDEDGDDTPLEELASGQDQEVNLTTFVLSKCIRM